VSAAVSGPHRQDAIAERDRVGRLARARELILGVQDGLHLPLAVVTGLASANVAKTALVVAGTAEAAAGAIAKATEAFLAARAEDELYDVEVAKELGEVDAQRGVEVEELAALLHDEGVPEAAARASATAIATSPDEGREGARSPLPRAPIGPRDSVIIGVTYGLAALVPLWPYLVWDLSTAMAMSFVSAAVALVALAFAKRASRALESHATPWRRRCALPRLRSATSSAGQPRAGSAETGGERERRPTVTRPTPTGISKPPARGG
jgi:VIT1/CCC1 family predicted Fe2+/Mn2+ transporter